MNSTEFTIITPRSGYVKPGRENRHVRIRHADIAAQDIVPEIRARSRHVARCVQKRQGVRVPAMRGSEWGQFLRCLELKRALG